MTETLVGWCLLTTGIERRSKAARSIFRCSIDDGLCTFSFSHAYREASVHKPVSSTEIDVNNTMFSPPSQILVQKSHAVFFLAIRCIAGGNIGLYGCGHRFYILE